MNFGVNPLQNQHLEPRNSLDLFMIEPVEEAGRPTAVEFDGDGGGGGGGEIQREHMFDKVVTPSDVGKLNRLVIPKQHAERFFPLDSSTNEKGLLLNFEDRNGKSWRFRYSYWNSSQSYVMTKGWSRFVKEKRLDAGDIVSFQRGVGEIGRDHLYIDWRRRPELPITHHHHHHHPVGIRPGLVVPASATAWGSLVWRPLGAAATGYHQHQHQHHPAATTPRDHAHLSQIHINNNNNYNNNNNIGIGIGINDNNVNVVYDWNRGCCPYGAYGKRVAPRLVGDIDGEEELEGNNQVEQEYFSGGGGGGTTMVVQRNYEEEVEDQEEEDTPVKKSRKMRLFGVNMEIMDYDHHQCPINSSVNSSNSDELCDLLLSSSSNSNPKTTTLHQFQLPSSHQT